jgi:translation initiation factor 4G
MTEIQVKYDIQFILSLKGVCCDCPFDKPITVIKPKRDNKWNRGELVNPPLVRGENAWVSVKTTDENEIIYKEVQGILNKLSRDNFESLSKKMVSIDIDNQDLVARIIKLVFNKVVDEPHFSEIYADLCKSLADKEYCGGAISFKREILTQCQNEFESKKSDTKKRKSLGNMRFIGELYIKDIVSMTIVLQCINMLFHGIENTTEKERGIHIECLCKLMTTIGEKIDNPNNKIKIDGCFEILQSIYDNKKNEFRYRFMVLDLIDLRKNSWVSRKKLVKVTSKEEVRKDFQKEKYGFK